MDSQDNAAENEVLTAEAGSAHGVEPKPTLELEEQQALIEALIFGHGEPNSLEALSQISGLETEAVRALIEQIITQYNDNASGIELLQIGETFQFRTRNRFSAYVRELKTLRPRKLTQQALETLAIVAYRQPIVKSDIEKLRGVDATPTLNTLLERKLIRIVGHQTAVGSPALYGTSDEFLKVFGLRSLAELPSPRDLKELEDPGEATNNEQERTAPEISI